MRDLSSSAVARRELAARLVALVRSFEGRRIAVLGDLIADEFLYGDIARVSREAPVLILEQRQTVVVPGGGANSVANLRALGAQPLPVGVIGDDDAGHRLVEAFHRADVDTRGVVVLRGYATPAKCRILAGGVHTRRQQIVRLDRGSARAELPARARSGLRRRLRTAVASAGGLLIADYGFGAASPAIVEGLLPRWTARGLSVTADSRGRVTEFRGIRACTPNQEELERALDTGPLSDEAVGAAGRRLLRRCATGAVLVTRGAKGMMLVQPRRSALVIPAFGTDEVADVTGAGDTVIATFTLALVAGSDPADAARIANYAAGLVVTKAGTATVTRRELLGAIREDLE